ncbi:MAG: hypothetical protein R3346_02110 [Candidatus Spechtbacterales bacterium]|nr:hypothetical protein [Candidatus Spechtbacterales bacterium]
MARIGYRLIGEAIEYYKELGYEYISVPWAVPKHVVDITAPSEAELFPLKDKYLLASGEQSFIYLMQQGKLEHGKKYLCVTPCFRDEEEYNEYTRLYFIKLELIIVGSDNPDDVEGVFSDASGYFQRYLPERIERLITDEGVDIMYNGIELGSYGTRKHESTGPWVYGTGVAEPRFSQVLSKTPKGYSMREIPKGELGEYSKIYEELQELQDAIEQGVGIMSLVELSDMYGAMESFLSEHFPGFTMEDIKIMSDTTKRAFRSGRRQ